MDKKLRYESLCFSIQEKENELSTLFLTTFILNPKIGQLTAEIRELNKEKNELEEELKNEEG